MRFRSAECAGYGMERVHPTQHVQIRLCTPDAEHRGVTSAYSRLVSLATLQCLIIQFTYDGRYYIVVGFDTLPRQSSNLMVTVLSKYFDRIEKDTQLSHNTGSAVITPPDFHALSSSIISQCSFIQSLIQNAIYTSHGAELSSARLTLKTFPNPRARVDFLCTFPYDAHDPVVVRVFDFARSLFRDLYEIRNVLAHELWSSSEHYPGAVLFSNLDESSRLLMASGRLWHKSDVTPEEISDAAIRFIRSVKVVYSHHLSLAQSDASLCAWSLLHINTILDEPDPAKKEEARKAFFVFRGTSHLFDNVGTVDAAVAFASHKEKSIER
jgi:hypothetical protein